MKIEGDTIKEKERRRRVNVWLYGPEVLEQAGLVRPDQPSMFYGTVTPAGLHLVTRQMAWDDPMVLDRVVHEAVHHWWSDQVGEAPSLLNEGVAACFERTLATDPVRRREELPDSWQEYAQLAEPGFLRRLCGNDTFWAEEAAGRPVYEVGGQLVSFLLESHGLTGLRRIFLNSHFEDPHLAEQIEEEEEITRGCMAAE